MNLSHIFCMSKALLTQGVAVQYCKRGIDVDCSKPLRGVIVLTLGGFCFGLLTPLFFIATSALPTTDYWRVLPDGYIFPNICNLEMSHQHCLAILELFLWVNTCVARSCELLDARMHGLLLLDCSSTVRHTAP